LLASIIAMSIVVAFANYAGIIGDLFSSIANSYEAAAR
jgi:Flp pilus assembly pilin Flp